MHLGPSLSNPSSVQRSPHPASTQAALRVSQPSAGRPEPPGAYILSSRAVSLAAGRGGARRKGTPGGWVDLCPKGTEGLLPTTLPSVPTTQQSCHPGAGPAHHPHAGQRRPGGEGHLGDPEEAAAGGASGAESRVGTWEAPCHALTCPLATAKMRQTTFVLPRPLPKHNGKEGSALLC